MLSNLTQFLRSLPYAVKVLLFAAVYYAAARLGLTFSWLDQPVSLLWPPSGLALAAILVFGKRYWPGIFLGAFLANFSAGGPILFALLAATGNTLEPVIGAWLLSKFSDFHLKLDRTRDVFGLVVYAAILSTMVSATLGVTGLCLTGAASWSSYLSLWSIWWLGDALSILVITPLLLSWATSRGTSWLQRRAQEVLLWLALVVALYSVTFSGLLPRLATNFLLSYFPIVFVLWAALRFGRRGTTTATLIVTAFAVIAPMNGLGFFARQTPTERILLVWAFSGIVALVGLFLTTAMAERTQIQKNLRDNEQNYRLLFTSAQRQAQELALLEHARTTIARQLELPAVIRTIVEAVSDTFGYKYVSVYMLEGDMFSLQHQVGYDRVVERVPLGKGVISRVVHSRQPLLINDVRADPDFIAAVDGLVSEIGVPLYDEERVVGVLNVESTDEIMLTKADLCLMVALSDHIGSAITRARLYSEVRKSEESFRQIYELAPIGMSLVDTEGRFIGANQAYLKLLGYSAAELRAINFVEITHPDDLPYNMTLFGQLTRGEIAYYQLEKRFFHKDGRIVITSVHATFLRDSQGKPFQIVSQVLDITEQKRTDAALRESSAKLAASRDTLQRLIQQTPVGIQVFDADGLCVDVNQAHLAIFGIQDRGSLVERYNILNDPLAEWVGTQAAVKRVLAGEVVNLGDLAFDFSRGDARYVDLTQQRVVNVTLFPIFDQDASVVNFVGLNLDVTERKRMETDLRRLNVELEQRVQARTAELQRERSLLQAILDAMGEGVIYGAHYQIRYVNRAMADLTGYTIEELISQQTMHLPGPSLSDQLIGLFTEEASSPGLSWRGNTRLRRKDGSEFDAAFTATLISENSEIVGAVTIVRDITEEKQLQQQKARFIANASHELRTPLTNIRMRLYLLRKQPEKFEVHMQVLERAAEYMSGLVEDLLDVARFERGTLPIQRLDVCLQELIEDAVQLQHLEAESKHIDLAVDLPREPVYVFADPKRMTQVIVNLLANAVNYTPDEGRVSIQLQSEVSDLQHFAVIRIQDTGSGIAAQHLSRVFEPFFRASEGPSRGTGLGLSISKEIVELHQGQLTVESTPGSGSTFSIKLALHPGGVPLV